MCLILEQYFLLTFPILLYCWCVSSVSLSQHKQSSIKSILKQASDFDSFIAASSFLACPVCSWDDSPVKNLSSQLTHCELTWKLTASTFWGHSSSSQRTHKMSLLWAICEINQWANHAVAAVSSLWCHCLPHGEIFRLSSLCFLSQTITCQLCLHS